MRYWHAIHLERWQSFLTGLDDLLREHSTEGVPADLPTRQVQAVPLVAAEPLPAGQGLVEAQVAIPAGIPEQKAFESGPSADVADAHPLPFAASGPLPQGAEPSHMDAPADTGGKLQEAHLVQPVPSAPAVIPSPVSSMARAFFAAIGWGIGGGASRPAASIMPASGSQAVATEQPPATASGGQSPVFGTLVSQAASFFQHLPWDGVAQFGEVIASFRVTADRDFAGLDPRTAELPGGNLLLSGMLSAARTSDRMAAAPAPAASGRARAFFSSIPWAHA